MWSCVLFQLYLKTFIVELSNLHFSCFVEPANQVATMEVDTDVEGTNGEDGLVQNEHTCWD